MTVFRINLIRDRAISPLARVRLFWGMLAYLLVCGVLLVWTVNHATRRTVGTWRHLGQVRHMEEQFQRKRPHAGGLSDYARRLKADLSQTAQTLESLQAFLSSRRALAEVIVRLSSALPASAQIASMSLDGETRAVAFGVVVPDDVGSRAIQGPDLIALWARDPVLTGRVKGLRSVLSQREKIEGRNCIVLKFECTLAGGG